MNYLQLFSLLGSIAFCAGSEYDGWLTFDIFHQVGCRNANFCPRGKISVKSIRAGTVVIEQDDLTPIAIKELKELAEQNGFYILMLRAISSDKSEEEFLTSVSAKAFVQSGYQDVLNVWLNNNGGVVGISAQVDGTVNNQTGSQIKTKFYLRHIEQAPVPDTASYIQKLEREREAHEKGEQKDNRSFLAKYWMYIVPVAIFVMISGAANPDQGSGPAR